LTFKARTDDLRDSPSLAVIGKLLEAGASVKAYDPTTRGTLRDPYGAVEVCDDPYAACAGAGALLVLTEWDDFRWLDFDKVADAMAVPAIIDTRNLLDPGPLRRRGFSYVGMGRR
jgi:UDPglucose 6-dehydrogenase